MYIKVLIQNCMISDNEDDPITNVTKECHDNKVVALLKTESFSDTMKIDWNHYSKCVKEQDDLLNKGLSDSFLVRDMNKVKFVGSVFHPSISV